AALSLLAAAAAACGGRKDAAANPDSVSAAEESADSATAAAATSSGPAAQAGPSSSAPLTAEDVDRWKRGMDAELAAVMGHEMAHALREHARERASEQLGAQVLVSGAVLAIGGGQTSKDLGDLFYKTFFGLPNSRLHETEADRIGVELAARAGYDPRAAISLWRKMDVQAGSNVPEFLSTHPSASTRLADLAVYAQRVMPLYEEARRGR
ncbi:MAG: M48 family metallopeptidase, partial [Gammaproteobacteria bacterium]